MVNCFVDGCTSYNRSDGEEVQYFRLTHVNAIPNADLVKKWKDALSSRSKRIFDEDDRSHLICERHFKTEHIIKSNYVEKSVVDGVQLSRCATWYGLANDAVPTLFPDCPGQNDEDQTHSQDCQNPNELDTTVFGLSAPKYAPNPLAIVQTEFLQPKSPSTLLRSDSNDSLEESGCDQERIPQHERHAAKRRKRNEPDTSALSQACIPIALTRVKEEFPDDEVSETVLPDNPTNYWRNQRTTFPRSDSEDGLEDNAHNQECNPSSLVECEIKDGRVASVSSPTCFSSNLVRIKEEPVEDSEPPDASFENTELVQDDGTQCSTYGLYSAEYQMYSEPEMCNPSSRTSVKDTFTYNSAETTLGDCPEQMNEEQMSTFSHCDSGLDKSACKQECASLPPSQQRHATSRRKQDLSKLRTKYPRKCKTDDNAEGVAETQAVEHQKQIPPVPIAPLPTYAPITFIIVNNVLPQNAVGAPGSEQTPTILQLEPVNVNGAHSQKRAILPLRRQTLSVSGGKQDVSRSGIPQNAKEVFSLDLLKKLWYTVRRTGQWDFKMSLKDGCQVGYFLNYTFIGQTVICKKIQIFQPLTFRVFISDVNVTHFFTKPEQLCLQSMDDVETLLKDVSRKMLCQGVEGLKAGVKVFSHLCEKLGNFKVCPRCKHLKRSMKSKSQPHEQQT